MLHINSTGLLIFFLVHLNPLLVCQHLLSLSNVVGTTKQNIDLLKGNLLGLRDEEPNEDCK